jgi:cyclopropane fatty-acyl-phospholipid synthase-like methyltransferase
MMYLVEVLLHRFPSEPCALFFYSNSKSSAIIIFVSDKSNCNALDNTLTNTGMFLGRRVLELGCGTGALGLCACMSTLRGETASLTFAIMQKLRY